METRSLVEKRSLAVGFWPLALAALMLLGAGCLSDPSYDNVGQCSYGTPWGSCIDGNGIDWALIGTWQLQSQVLTTSAGTVTNPAYGRRTTFEVGTFDITDDTGTVLYSMPDATFSESYATEVFPVEADCTVSGGFGGGWNVTHDTNLDYDPSDPATGPDVIFNLEIITDPVNPNVVCEGADDFVVTSNAATTPLGVGLGASPVSGGQQRVEYTYTVSGPTLIIEKNAGSIINTYTYQRVQ